MKQIDIAVHNFHDTNRGLPPANIENDRPTIVLLIMPFIEMTGTYDLFVDKVTTAGSLYVHMPNFDWQPSARWQDANFVQDKATVASGFQPWRCPTRRGAAQGYNNYGPLSDYAVPVLHNIDVPPDNPNWTAGGNTVNPPNGVPTETKEWDIRAKKQFLNNYFI